MASERTFKDPTGRKMLGKGLDFKADTLGLTPGHTPSSSVTLGDTVNLSEPVSHLVKWCNSSACLVSSRSLEGSELDPVCKKLSGQ